MDIIAIAKRVGYSRTKHTNNDEGGQTDSLSTFFCARPPMQPSWVIVRRVIGKRIIGKRIIGKRVIGKRIK